MVSNKPGVVCHSGRHRPTWLVESNKRFRGAHSVACGRRRTCPQQNQMEPEWTPDCGRWRPRQNNSFEVNEAYANPRSDDWTKFVRVLQDLKQSSVEMDESGQVNSNASLTNTPVGGGAGGSNSLNSSSNILLPQVTPVSTSALQTVKSEPNFDYRSGFISPPNLTQAFISQLKQTPQTPK